MANSKNQDGGCSHKCNEIKFYTSLKFAVYTVCNIHIIESYISYLHILKLKISTNSIGGLPPAWPTGIRTLKTGLQNCAEVRTSYMLNQLNH